MGTMYKDFIVGGLLVSLARYMINKFDNNGVKYAGLIVHGVPIAFLVTLLLEPNNNYVKQLVESGIYFSVIITITMAILYMMLKKNMSKNNSLFISLLLWVILVFYYIKN